MGLTCFPHRLTVFEAVVISGLLRVIWGILRHSGGNIQRCLCLPVSHTAYSSVFKTQSQCTSQLSIENLMGFFSLMIFLFLCLQVTTSCQTTTNYELVSVMCARVWICAQMRQSWKISLTSEIPLIMPWSFLELWQNHSPWGCCWRSKVRRCNHKSFLPFPKRKSCLYNSNQTPSVSCF